ncbi:MAG: biopolymer transporter ExbB [Thalassobius sp.]|nr:biopolymer transporter ExbB [Thalassovita sp.]
MNLMLQPSEDTLNVVKEGITSPVLQDQIELWELVTKGGWIMAILGVLALVALVVFIERLILLKKAQGDPEPLLNKVNTAVLRGDIDGATAACREVTTPMSRMLTTGLTHIGSSLKNIEAAVENVGKIEIYRLEKNISILGTISGAAPMIGFFGTVIGMINAFIAISQEEGSVSPKLLSSGIYEAMITTAGGLFVGILAYVCYNYLVRQVSEVIHKMEVTSIEFIDLLQRPN